MARLDKARLLADATDVAIRANAVRQDPAVVNAAKQVREDAIQTCRSTMKLVDETHSAWRRTDRRI